MEGESNDSIVATATTTTAAGRSLDLHLRQQHRPAVADIDKSPTTVADGHSRSHSQGTPSSSTTTTTTSSPPQYSEEMRRAAALAGAVSLARQGSNSSTKTCEVDVGEEERDTFSPVTSNSNSNSSSNNNSPSSSEANAEAVAAICNGGGGAAGCGGATSNTASGGGSTTISLSRSDNKGSSDDDARAAAPPPVPPTSLKHQQSAAAHKIVAAAAVALSGGGGSGQHLATKEEKQRQNEEIVILETSSVSSETGSWDFLQNERPIQAAASTAPSSKLLSERTAVEKPDVSLKQHDGPAPACLLKEPDFAPYLRERTYSNGATATADTSSLFSGISTASLLREFDKRENALSTSGTSACFIDASSLRDEDEVLSFPSLDGQHMNDDTYDAPPMGKEADPESAAFEGHATNAGDGDEEDREPLPATALGGGQATVSPTAKLESFHMAFARCKVKTSKDSAADDDLPAQMDSKSQASSNSTSGADSPQPPASHSSLHNLSDEEKLWQRNFDVQKTPPNTANDMDDLKDIDPLTERNHSSSHHRMRADATEAINVPSHEADSLSDSHSAVARRHHDREAKLPQQHHQHSPAYMFQHNLHQFSIHPLSASPKFSVISQPPPSLAGNCGGSMSGAGGIGGGGTTTNAAIGHSSSNATAAHNPHSDLSYTTDYSSSSPAPSLVWSEHEHRPHTTVAFAAGARPPLPAHLQDEFDGPGHAAVQHRPSLLPDTPHNSMAHIDANSSNNSSIHRDCTLSSSFSHQRDSGAYCSDATDSPIPMPRTPRRASKYDEANPIVSGGVTILDFNVKQCQSPPVQRKTDSCPIVSGGFKSLDFETTRPLHEDDDDDGDRDADEEVEMRAKPIKRKPMAGGVASWVVDMSGNAGEGRNGSGGSSSSLETSGKFRERSDSTGSHKSGCGFFVSLDDMDKRPGEEGQRRRPAATAASAMSKSYTAPQSAGFYVNLSKSEYTAKVDDEGPTGSQPSDTESTDDKKNMFSMFIDLGNAGKPKAREPFSLAQRLSSSLTTASQRRSTDDSAIGSNGVTGGPRSAASSTETLMSKSSNVKTAAAPLTAVELSDERECKSLDYRCNREPTITVAQMRRISQQQRTESEAAKRHSWSNVEGGPVTGDYKRSISLTANGGNGAGNNGLMSIIDKLPLISKASKSSLSADSSISPLDDYSGSKSGLSSFSNNSARNSMSGGERDEDIAGAVGAGGITHSVSAGKLKKRRRDVQINETFDKSSVASLTDGLLSKDLSPAMSTDTEDLTFQQDEELALRETATNALPAAAVAAGAASTAIAGQLGSNRSSAIIMETIMEAKETSSPKKNAAGHTMESLHATIEKQKMLLETVNEHAEPAKAAAFVKLSDMDKPVKYEPHSPEPLMSKSAGNHRQISNRLYRSDDPKTRPHSWNMTRSTGNNGLQHITNSVDNLRSLSRLFPHISKELSNSLPNDVTLDHMQMVDYIQTDISADSSLASSFSRSAMDESSMSCRQPRRLGEDLLKMFLQEIATDMIVEVHGRRIRAHKCILRSRCQYFAAMLAGSGSSSVVSLQGYSYSAVHFALCHIYSGASHPPDGISLMELAALADLLGLEGLKEVTAHALKTNYCHNFHKPCSGCIDGILQVLPVALNHALDDLYRKCLRWACRHYLKVWPTRQFAQLSGDILGRCRQQIVAYLTSETVLDTVLDCDNLLAQLAPYRWGGICENLVRDILDAAYAYIADHFASLVASDAFLSLGHDRSCHIPRLEGLLLRTASSLTPDQACRSYQRVTRLNTVLQAKVIQMPANLGVLAKELQGLQEEDLDWDVEYIRLVSAILSAVEQCLIRQCSRAMRITAWQRMDLDLRKKIQTLARLTEPLDLKRSKPVSKAFSFGGSTRNQDLYQVKLAIQAHSKRALAQDTQLYKATQTTQDAGAVQTADRGVQANHEPTRDFGSKILKSNSRAHVPQPHPHRASSQSNAHHTAERNQVNTHRRTQSETPLSTSKSAASVPRVIESKAATLSTTALASSVPPTAEAAAKQKVRLTEIRPRYLEPRKSRGPATNGPVRSATSSSIPAAKSKGLHISSSDSSRNSSPAIRKAMSARIGNKSTNMSLDSLASPARRGKSVPRGGKVSGGDAERYSDVNVDSSLTESMKSSMITNKTHESHESLSGASKLSRSNPVITRTRVTPIRQVQLPKVNVNGLKQGRPTGIGSKPHKHLQQQHITSTGSSPSSVTTTKSATSRLSSVSSTQSARDVYKHRSISMPAQDATAGQSQRRSFLSAKTREILAKLAEKDKQQQLPLEAQQPAQVNTRSHQTRSSFGGPQRSASHSAVTAAAVAAANNRNSLPSNIPTRRPNTLHLKKTTAMASNGFGGSGNNANNNNHNNGNNSNKVSNTTTTNNTTTALNNNNNRRNRMVTNITTTTTNGVLKAAHAVRQKLEMLIDTSLAAPCDGAHDDRSGDEVVPLRIESKLERSSTFCKESSDLDMNDLHIIE